MSFYARYGGPCAADGCGVARDWHFPTFHDHDFRPKEAPAMTDDNDQPESIIIEGKENIAFARAIARLGALKLGYPKGVLAIVKDVYGLRGQTKKVIADLQEYVDGTLAIREWSPEYAERIRAIAQEALDRAEEENPGDPMNKDRADNNVQAAFDAGDITEQEGNDACTLIYVEVVRAKAGTR